MHRFVRDLMCWFGWHQWIETQHHTGGLVMEYYSCRNCDVPANPDALAAEISKHYDE